MGILLREKTAGGDAQRGARRPAGRELRGEVRADAYTRHLFAGDASLYSSAPLLVAFPRDAADVAAAVGGRRALRGPGRHAAAPARASPARPPGQGHRARHLAPHGRDRRGRRRARGACASAPASSRRTSTAPSRRHGLGFGPDTSTSNRATLGGMIGNNSSGSHSIVYGTTIDHVHELEVVLADGSTARLRAGRRARAGAPRGGRHARGRDLPRPAGDPARARPRDRRGLPAPLAPVRRLPARPPRAASSTSRKFVTGSEGTLVAITEATVGLIELPKAKSSRSGTSTRSTRRSPRPRTRSRSTRRRSR